jgi:hypothetical protein
VFGGFSDTYVDLEGSRSPEVTKLRSLGSCLSTIANFHYWKSFHNDTESEFSGYKTSTSTFRYDVEAKRTALAFSGVRRVSTYNPLVD